MLKITLFGPLTLSTETVVLSEEDGRSHKLWQALGYLLHRRAERVDLREFAAFLSEGKCAEKSVTHMLNERQRALIKTTLHRLRALLSVFTGDEPACRLLWRNGAVYFDPALRFDADSDRFDRLVRRLTPREGRPLSERNPEEALSLYRSLAALYRGRYLPRLADSPWAAPISEAYHKTFVSLSEEFLPLLFEKGCYGELRMLTRRAFELDPGCDTFSYWRIRSVLAAGERELALSLYDSLLRLYYDKLHLNPTARLRRLHDALVVPPPLLSENPSALLAALTDGGCFQKSVPDGVFRNGSGWRENLCLSDFSLFLGLLRRHLLPGQGIFLLVHTDDRKAGPPPEKTLDACLASFVRGRGCFCRPAPNCAVLFLLEDRDGPFKAPEEEARALAEVLSSAGVSADCSGCDLCGS